MRPPIGKWNEAKDIFQELNVGPSTLSPAAYHKWLSFQPHRKTFHSIHQRKSCACSILLAINVHGDP